MEDDIGSDYQPARAYQHLEKGMHLEQQGRLDEAMIEFKRAVDADPSMAAAHTALGHHYQRKGLLTRAADEFRSAARISDDYDSHYSLGHVLIQLEQYDEAAEAFERCLTLVHDDPSARFELAFVRCQQGRFEVALAGLESLLAEYPEDWELPVAMANCYIAMRRYDEAEGALHQALQQVPTQANTTAIYEALRLISRHREFSSRNWTSMKERYYTNYGVAYVGTGSDDGIDIHPYADLQLDYDDVAVSVLRALALLNGCAVTPNVIVNLDETSLPLAIAIGHLLELPVVPLQTLHADDYALLVLAEGSRPELLQVALDRAICPVVSFCLLLNWIPEQGPLPDIIGVACDEGCSLPWTAESASPTEVATSVLRAMQERKEEPNLDEQVNYYCELHSQLRFLEPSSDIVSGGEFMS